MPSGVRLKKKQRVAAPAPAAAPPPTNVQSVFVAFQTWIPFCLHALASSLGDIASLDAFAGYAQRLTRVTTSSAFSGVGAPETAFVNLAQYFCFMLSDTCLDDFHLAPLWALAIDAACRAELMRGLSAPY